MAEQDQRARCRRAATTTGAGAPASHATDGSATVAATEPSEIDRDEPDRRAGTRRRRRRVATGASTAKTPAATATPLPPWKRSQTG